jgi:signal transduction histidine kinase
VETEDRQRARLAVDLEATVLTEVAAAAAQLDAVAPRDGSSQSLAIARAELASIKVDMLGLVRGVPPSPLGGGGLPRALTHLAAQAPFAVELHVDPDVKAAERTETVLFYVCSEALANAAKHGSATRVDVGLTQLRGWVTLVVQDDGPGGADPSGRGLLGLADRVESVGGELLVRSPLGEGTTVSASVPA